MTNTPLIEWIKKHKKLTKKQAWIIAILYLISPVDFIPDIVPPFTYADDALGLVLAALYRPKDEEPIELKVA